MARWYATIIQRDPQPSSAYTIASRRFASVSPGVGNARTLVGFDAGAVQSWSVADTGARFF